MTGCSPRNASLRCVPWTSRIRSGTTSLFLAPMAGVSESPFRLLARRFGADVVVSEFISAVGVARGLEHLFHDMRFEPAERPIGIQLYGADATVMARAA